MIGLVLTAGSSAASAAQPAVTPGFTWSPHDPIVGQQVTFISTSTATGNNSIQQELWDLNGDGQFGDQSGRSVVTTFSTPGPHVVRLRVVDKHAANHNHVRAETVVVQAFANRSPVASFVHYPPAPQPSQVINFYSTATDPDSAIVVQRWDLDGDGSYVDATGPTASRSFALPGKYTIGLQVEDAAGGVDVATATLDVSATSAIASSGDAAASISVPGRSLLGHDHRRRDPCPPPDGRRSGRRSDSGAVQRSWVPISLAPLLASLARHAGRACPPPGSAISTGRHEREGLRFAERLDWPLHALQDPARHAAAGSTAAWCPFRRVP